MGKTIFVLLDACRYDLGTIYLSAPEHWIDCGAGAKYRVMGELPSLSRPMYETLMTGLLMSRHGITSNAINRPSVCENVFSQARAGGLKTGAAAYYWMSELYNHAPFDKRRDRIQEKTWENGGIDYGMFYWDDGYPDSHLFADGEWIRTAYEPDFMMYHSMAIDEMGHLHGCGSREYAAAITCANEVLADLLPYWFEDGYDVVITADHGMNELGIHGGKDRGQREVPLYIFSKKVQKGRYEDGDIPQTNIAPLLLRMLGLPAGKEMKRELDIEMKVQE